MAPDDTDGRKPSAPAVLRIKLRYDSVEAMVNRFAPNVGKLGIFLPTKSIHPPGTEIKFELKLVTDVPMLVGLGRVMSSHDPDPNNPRAVFGIAVEIIRVTREGRQLLVRLIERRRAMGLPDVAIPIPADIYAARRADIDTQPRAQIPTAGTSLLGQHSEPVLTAPRASAVPRHNEDAADRNAVPMLAPEPVRPPRRRVADVIAAAHPIAAVTEEQASLLNHDIDVESTRARARALASGDLDGELAALREAAAAPLPIEIEAASAELARHVGGIAVKRDRSAPVAVPVVHTAPTVDDSHVLRPPTADPMPTSEPDTATSSSATVDPEVASEAESPDIAQSSATTADPPAPTQDPTAEPLTVGVSSTAEPIAPQGLDSGNALEQPLSDTAVPSAEDDDPDLLSFERDLDAARVQTGVTHTPAPPAPPNEEASADDDNDDDDDVDELDDSELEHLRVITPPAGIAVSSAQTIHPDATAIPVSARDVAVSSPSPTAFPAPTSPPRVEGEEVSDVDVLAEASEEDDDLLHAHLRRDELGHSPVPPSPLPPEFLDPADLAPAPIEPLASLGASTARTAETAPYADVSALRNEAHAPYADPSALRSSAYAQYEEAYDDAHYDDAPYEGQSVSYSTNNASRQYPDDFDYDFASRLDLDDDDEPAHAMDAGRYAFADQLPPSRVASAPLTLDEPYGLDDALSNLDADSELPAVERRRTSPSRRPPLPGMPQDLRHDPSGTAQEPRRRRFATDDGVTIDFDDDDES